jgi:hypothetical protein
MALTAASAGGLNHDPPNPSPRLMVLCIPCHRTHNRIGHFPSIQEEQWFDPGERF